MSFLLKQGSTAVASSLSMASVSSYTFIAVDAATWGGNLSRSLAAHPRVQILSQMDDRSLTGPRTVNMPPKILQNNTPGSQGGDLGPRQFRNAGRCFF
jgi:hypothetical protein